MTRDPNIPLSPTTPGDRPPEFGETGNESSEERGFYILFDRVRSSTCTRIDQLNEITRREQLNEITHKLRVRGHRGRVDLVVLKGLTVPCSAGVLLRSCTYYKSKADTINHKITKRYKTHVGRVKNQSDSFLFLKESESDDDSSPSML
jgi:hypothetical protein